LIPVLAILYLLFALIGLILFLINLLNLNYLILIWSPVILYLIIDIICTVNIMARYGSLKHISALMIFPAIHIGYGIGFLKGLITK